MSVMQACAKCGGQIRGDAGWCSLCLTPVGRFDPLTAPLAVVAGTEGVSPDQPPAPAQLAAPQQPVPHDPTADPVGEVASPPEAPEPAGSSAEPPVDVDTMLVLLAAEHRSQEPLVGLADRLGERSTRAVVIAAGAVGLSVVLFAVLALLSLLV